VRIAILTDIHANREALSAVLADIAQRQVTRIVCLGDIVGYGPDPVWCTERVMQLAEAGATVIRGNHDAAVIADDPALNVTARRAILWTRPLLSDSHRAFLDALPLTCRDGDMLFVHASANDPQDWIYVSAESRATGSFRAVEDRLIFCGHVHVPALYSCDMAGTVRAQRIPMGMPVPLIRSRRWLGVIGSVGQARDGVAAAGYALFDVAQNELTFRRVPYDVATTVAKLRAAGLPESLAMRLNWGA
jgi:diadenosine tetraphosphatase ApaH/serine/threonine PP2A family protein phosphatase